VDEPCVYLQVSDHHLQEADALRDHLHRAAVLLRAAGRGVLLHQRGARREAELQGDGAAVHLRPAAHPQGPAALHRGRAAHDR